MNDEHLTRYSRHILLPSIGFEGQDKLSASRVLIIGMGGLGSPLAMYLAASGVGQLVIADGDQVDLSNLQRQIVHRTADIGRAKVESARATLLALNPLIDVMALPERLAYDVLRDAVSRADVVADCSDNFATRFAVNAACVATRTPLVSGAAIRMEGQVGVFNLNDASPCYRCLYQEQEDLRENCASMGIFAPLVGIIGSIQATEVLKILLGVGEPLSGRLLLCDASTMEWRTLVLRKDSACPCCAT